MEGPERSIAVHGAGMGTGEMGLSATLDPKALQGVAQRLAAAGGEGAPPKPTARPHSAVVQRAIGRGSERRAAHSPAGTAQQRTSAAQAERRTVLDDKALRHIREDLVNSLPRTLTWPGRPREGSPLHGSSQGAAAERRARLHDSPSRNPVAERRFPGAAAARAVGGGGGGRVQGLVG